MGCILQYCWLESIFRNDVWNLLQTYIDEKLYVFSTSFAHTQYLNSHDFILSMQYVRMNAQHHPQSAQSPRDGDIVHVRCVCASCPSRGGEQTYVRQRRRRSSSWNNAIASACARASQAYLATAHIVYSASRGTKQHARKKKKTIRATIKTRPRCIIERRCVCTSNLHHIVDTHRAHTHMATVLSAQTDDVHQHRCATRQHI